MNKTLTKSVSQSEIVTFAVYLLGGLNKFVDTEDVAVKAFEIAPERFSWKKYPDQINLELVRVSLSDAKKPEKGEHLFGSGRRGWSLTVNGRDWISANPDLLERDLAFRESVPRAGSVDVIRASRESKRVRSTGAWEQWEINKHSVTAAQAKEVFRIDSYTKPEMLDLKLHRLLKLLGDEAILSEFLKEMSRLVREEGKL